MKAFPVFVAFLGLSSVNLRAQRDDAIRKMESSGDTAGARIALSRAAEANPNNIPALTAYAEFLDRYGDAGARDAYAKVLAASRRSSDPARTGVMARRLAVLDLLAGDRTAAARNLEAYRSASGKS